jgi:1,2-diacylglycerol 3-alpha-glucosyltransferase
LTDCPIDFLISMRVAIFSESYEPVPNGVSTSVRTLVDELRARKHHAFVIAPHYPDYEDESPFVMRVPSLLTPYNADYPVPYPWFPRLRRNFGKTDPHVLHSQSPWFLGLLASRIARDEGIPLVSTYHTLYNHYAHYLFFLPQPAIERLLFWWMPEYYNRCANVIVPSRVAEQSLRYYGVTAQIEVIPTAVPVPGEVPEEVKQAARLKWEVQPDAPLLLYVGRMAKEKNIELVLDAFDAVADDFREARLLIVGAGPHLETLAAYAEKLGSGGRVIFAGALPHSDLPPLYATADLFVFGSSTETQGLVIAEARAAGTPCVVINGGGAPENVRHGEDGLVVEPTTEAFAGGIRQVLGDPVLRAQMAAACLRNAQDYTPGAMADRVLSVYEKAINQARKN